jgi:hypothetical protein
MGRVLPNKFNSESSFAARHHDDTKATENNRTTPVADLPRYMMPTAAVFAGEKETIAKFERREDKKQK